MKKYLIIFILLLSTSAWGATFYCDCSVTNGTDGAGSFADPFESVADIEAYEAATGFADGDDIYFLEGSTCDAMTDDLDVKHNGVDENNYSIFGCYVGDVEGNFNCTGTRPKLERYGGSYIIQLHNQPTQYVRFEYLNLRNTDVSWQNSGQSCIGTYDDGARGGNAGIAGSHCYGGAGAGAARTIGGAKRVGSGFAGSHAV